MIQITKQQMVDFIFSQPDEREVDMVQAHPEASCGCVMVHYGKEHNIPFSFCGTSAFSVKELITAVLIDCNYGTFWSSPSLTSKYTYKELKEHLRAKGLQPTGTVSA